MYIYDNKYAPSFKYTILDEELYDLNSPSMTESSCFWIRIIEPFEQLKLDMLIKVLSGVSLLCTCTTNYFNTSDN